MAARWFLLPICLLLVLTPAHGHHYVGCYRDAGNRDLPVLAERGPASIERCNHMCTTRHFKFFGLQNGDECWCGNSYGKHGAKPEHECNKRCRGRNDESCGAGWRNSVHTTDYVAGLHYIGCFADTGNRDLTHFAGSGGMSVHRCFEICRSLNFVYFGLQNSNECFCGTTYGRYGVRPDSECNMHCQGDSNSLCGAGWRNNVYGTGLGPSNSQSSSSNGHIREKMAAKIRSMQAPMPGGVVCSSCLISAFRRQKVDHSSEDFHVSELNARMSRYPAKARDKLRVLQFGVNAKTTFEDSHININPNHATKSTYFGIAERVGSRVHLGMVSTEIVATLVHKYNVFQRRVCRKIIFWTRCKNHTIRERRGYHGDEIRQIDTALQSETMNVFLENLGHIHV